MIEKPKWAHLGIAYTIQEVNRALEGTRLHFDSIRPFQSATAVVESSVRHAVEQKLNRNKVENGPRSYWTKLDLNGWFDDLELQDGEMASILEACIACESVTTAPLSDLEPIIRTCVLPETMIHGLGSRYGMSFLQKNTPPLTLSASDDGALIHHMEPADLIPGLIHSWAHGAQPYSHAAREKIYELFWMVYSAICANAEHEYREAQFAMYVPTNDPVPITLVDLACVISFASLRTDGMLTISSKPKINSQYDAVINGIFLEQWFRCKVKNIPFPESPHLFREGVRSPIWRKGEEKTVYDWLVMGMSELSIEQAYIQTPHLRFVVTKENLIDF